VIIVGASGYVGHSLYENRPKTIKVYGTSSRGTDELLALDLVAPNKFDYSVIQPLDTVIITAAISAPDVCSREYEFARSVNVTGTSIFIENVITCGGRIIFLSSDTVYGEKKDSFNELAECSPAGEYAQLKHEIEKQFLGSPLFKAVRLSYVFSSEDKFTKYLLGCIARAEEADIFHPFYRAIIHRDDVVDGIFGLAQQWENFPQAVFNFGGPEVLSRIEFVEIFKETAFPRLKFIVSNPEKEFFINRPKVICMKSPTLNALLGRPAHTLREAALIEFKKGQNKND
jgi:dTDP-4-dehydrorhamnose reductase